MEVYGDEKSQTLDVLKKRLGKGKMQETKVEG